MTMRLDLATGQFYTIDVPVDRQLQLISAIREDKETCEVCLVNFPGVDGSVVCVDVCLVVAILAPDLRFDSIERDPWIDA